MKVSKQSRLPINSFTVLISLIVLTLLTGTYLYAFKIVLPISKRSASLVESGVVTLGVVKDVYPQGTRNTIVYDYYVNREKFTSADILSYWDSKSAKQIQENKSLLKIRDVFIVVYDSTNIADSKILLDYPVKTDSDFEKFKKYRNNRVGKGESHP